MEDMVCACPEGWVGEVCNTPGMNIKPSSPYYHDSDRPSTCKDITGTYIISTHYTL